MLSLRRWHVFFGVYWRQSTRGVRGRRSLKPIVGESIGPRAGRPEELLRRAELNLARAAGVTEDHDDAVIDSRYHTISMNVRKLFDLAGRVAIVTGGSIGLGRQMAEGLAEMGASLVLCARKQDRCQRAAEELQPLGVRVLALACDVTDPASIHSMVEATLAEFGRIDILVNNAGISWGAPAEEMRLEDWNKVLATNLTGTFLCAQAVGKIMMGQRRGKIINMASIAGLGGAPADILSAPGYHASKGAVIALTRDLACKWAPHGINVNAIAPGWFPTHMSERVIEHKKELLLKSIPSGRLGSDHDLKGAAVFLASDASDYVNGQVLVVDGGLSA